MMVPIRLRVYLHNSLSGLLWLDDNRRFSFQYDPNYLKDQDSIPLSLSLPLREEPYTNDTPRPFFGNLLPEGEVRSLIAKIKQISEHNDFKLLEAIGGECAGAVSIVSEHTTYSTESDYIALSGQEVEDIIEENAIRPVLIIKDELRLSLAGAQNKIPLYIDDGKFYLTLGIAPSSHILKPQSPYFADVVQNEHFCMKLARAALLPAPKSFIWKGKNHFAYIVERYDRIKAKNGKMERLHQEDLCQVLGYMPDQKYENEGGPGLSECGRIIELYSSNPILDKQALVKWVTFNYFIGNADAHGKNISLIRERTGSTRLAPFYDLISTRVYPEISSKMAMKIGKESRFDWVMERHWQQMADQLDLKYTYLKRLLKQIAGTLETVMAETADIIISGYNGKKTIQKICEIITAHIKHVKTYL
ncbi:MAG: type II toxin-antitoxin system HipA family toxin [Deltaproteobacteria bacterium]|nr:type II toxin-antitoxin system HipA family toxin [Deltaproteobacteria bacterium]